MSRDSLLIRDGNPDRIMALVSERPGITKSELTQELDLGWGTVDYHLRALLKKKLVQLHKVHPKVHVYDSEIPDDRLAMIAALRLPRSSDIVELLRHPVRAQDLVDDLGASRRVVDRHLLHLARSGVVERDRFRYSLSSVYNRVFGGE
jgi:predicted transcriptional regulator